MATSTGNGKLTILAPLTLQMTLQQCLNKQIKQKGSRLYFTFTLLSLLTEAWPLKKLSTFREKVQKVLLALPNDAIGTASLLYKHCYCHRGFANSL
jgi:hypothetical protein